LQITLNKFFKLSKSKVELLIDGISKSKCKEYWFCLKSIIGPIKQTWPSVIHQMRTEFLDWQLYLWVGYCSWHYKSNWKLWAELHKYFCNREILFFNVYINTVVAICLIRTFNLKEKYAPSIDFSWHLSWFEL